MASTWDWTGKAKVPSATSVAGRPSTKTGHIMDISDHEIVVQSTYIDASTYNMTASDIYQIFKVGAGFTPIRFLINIATSEGTASSLLYLGDGSSTTRYENDLDFNQASVPLMTGSAPDAYTMYSAADTIDVIPTKALDTAKFTITMIGCYSKIA
jgi:hypothetical protein